MRRTLRHLALPLVLLTLGASDITAQPPGDDAAPPLYAAAVTGLAVLTRDGAASPLDANSPVVDGDRVRTSAGRVELADPAGSTAFVDEHTTVDLVAPGRLRLGEGRVRLVSGEASGLRVETTGGRVGPMGAGDCLIEVAPGPRGDHVMLTVFAGTAQFEAERGTVRVEAGERASVTGAGDVALAGGGRAPSGDDFDQWVSAQMAQWGTSDAPTAAYLPDELQPYDRTLNENGAWDYAPDYGYVWYPSVPDDWRPYSAGRWDRVGRYGWFWVGADAWSWPTHHYGRWGYRDQRWFWIPERRWAPAWVSWGVGPGYVGWCPLGRNDTPVFAFSSEAGYGASYTRGRREPTDHWRGWNVVPSEHFLSRQPVARGRVDGHALPREVAAAFVTQRVPPSTSWGRGYAVPRGWGASSPGVSTGDGRGIPPTRVESPAPSSVTPVVIAPPREREASPYDRARQYMDRRNLGVSNARPVPPVQGEDAGAASTPDTPATTTPAAGVPYEGTGFRRGPTHQGTSGGDAPDHARPPARPLPPPPQSPSSTPPSGGRHGEPSVSPPRSGDASGTGGSGSGGHGGVAVSRPHGDGGGRSRVPPSRPPQ